MRCARPAGGSAMCSVGDISDNSANYRKYGVISTTKIDDGRRLDKKDQQKKKVQLTIPLAVGG